MQNKNANKNYFAIKTYKQKWKYIEAKFIQK